MSKYIFVTGGVVSSLGKGICAASIGRLLQLYGYSVNIMKCDPYINVDPGTMSPYQHGEVYVTDDGSETDLDLGYYERFLDISTGKENSITAGKVYQTIISKERKGEFLGATVQVIPHVTNEIKSRFSALEKKCDVTIIEIGGTVGDIESLPFLEAARQFVLDKGRNNVLSVHVTLIPYLPTSGELKTKPTQHSVNKLREIGLHPDIIICRTSSPITDDMKRKLSLFCSVEEKAVVQAMDESSIYKVPQALYKQNIMEQVFKNLHMKPRKKPNTSWFNIINKGLNPSKEVTIAVAGKYSELKDAYKSIYESLNLAGMVNDAKVNIKLLDTEKGISLAQLKNASGILIPGGFGYRGVEGKIKVIEYARNNKIPFFGICLGMQCAVIESARNLAGLKGANSTEFEPKTEHNVIDILESQKSVKDKGGTMRLGAYTAQVEKDSLTHKAYGSLNISERHRHRYEFNPKYVKALAKAGLKTVAYHKSETMKAMLPEIVELKGHPWFVGVQFHPEFKSRPIKTHPLFRDFVKASLKHCKK
ncbi:MAG: CTP synthase [Elusimicrobiaceae bacterium]|jgi:CTP synthase|nr:CTP synthase [Elusimicrobiaceae bacterium]MBT3955673.1 CTP synthase [Elusimicrobiaceae bacterium]MBT4008273.1 CTP synthase [Elusimicrobiaceae bacterium]MBT4402340.1 CTP synthase [Elusimicrobiaceae bacterium]MBT4439803.1 CTP synthase [Elusimicrobiaceae bacterium]